MDLGIKQFAPMDLAGIIKQEEIEALWINAQGKPVFANVDAQKIRIAMAQNEKLHGKPLDVRGRTERLGGFTKTNHLFAQVNPEMAFKNRYRKIEQKGKTHEYHIVTDYRAIKEMDTGRTYSERIKVHVFTTKDKKLQFKNLSYIGSKEFIEEFKRELDVPTMKKLKPYMDDAPDLGGSDNLENLIGTSPSDLVEVLEETVIISPIEDI